MLIKMKRLIKKMWNQDAEDGWTREETEFLPAALEVVEMTPSPVGRTVLWTLVVLIVCVLLWSFWGSIDEVAVAPGKLIPVGNVKIIQAEDKGVVKSIHVKDGEKVKKGQLLVELDTTITAADLARTKKDIANYSLEMERLLSEKEGTIFIPKKYPDLDERDIAFQEQLYQSRMADYNTKMGAAQASVMQNQVSLSSARAAYIKMQSLYDIAKQREKMVGKLVDQDAVATFVLFDYREKRIEMEKEIDGQTAEIERLMWLLKQSQEAEANVRAERMCDVNDKLVEDRRKLQASIEELKKAEEKNRLSGILAPIDGRVSQLAVHTVGGIVTAAQPLLELVPEGVEMQVEAWVANKDIGFISKGQKAEIKIETFNFQKYGTVVGKVIEISPDAVDDKDKGRVYRVLLSLDTNSFSINNKEVSLAPGMTATGEIKIRKKKVIEYFLDTFRQYRSEALRER